jgi:hypothetical protein
MLYNATSKSHKTNNRNNQKIKVKMATKNLRALLKPTPISSLRKLVDEEDSHLSKGGQNDYVNLVDGKNKIRWWPAHPEHDKFLAAVSKVWLPMEKDNGDLGKTTALNAKIHGKMTKDLVEEYVKLATKRLQKSKESEDVVKLKDLTNGMKGLVYGNSWVGYADLYQGDKKLSGLLEIKRSVRDAMNNQAFIEGEDEEIAFDPFTDPDTGRPITVVYDSKAKTATAYYKTTVSNKPLPLEDDDMEAFLAKTPLSEMFVFSTRDFEKQIEGLRLYDLEKEIGVFEDDDFQELIEELRGQVIGVDDSESKTSTKQSTKSSKKKVVEEVDEEDSEIEEDEESKEEDGDKFDEMSRKDLIKFKNDNELDIKLLKTDSDDDMREKIRAVWKEDSEEVEEEDEDIEDSESEEEVEEVKPVKKQQKSDKVAASVDKLAALKKKLLAGKQ